MSGQEERIRETAYRLWLEEGSPQGRDQAHWEKACAIVEWEEAQGVATRSDPAARGGADQVQAVEEIAAATTGARPSLAGEDEVQPFPTPAKPRRAAARRQFTGTTTSSRAPKPKRT